MELFAEENRHRRLELAIVSGSDIMLHGGLSESRRKKFRPLPDG
jgi:hypothetical protein